MANVVSIVDLELKPGFSDDQIRELAADTVRDFKVAGVIHPRLARADRGDRDGKYVFVWEFDSVETRNRYWPGGKASDEWRQKIEGAPAAILERYSRMFAISFTDYVVLGE